MPGISTTGNGMEQGNLSMALWMSIIRTRLKNLQKKDINLAFVPFDPKLGMYQSLGMEYFLENTNAEYVFPMHMWQDYSGIQPFIKRLSNQAMANRIVPIVHENQVFEIREE